MNKEEFITERTRIISEMLDNPDEYGIYPTTKCFNDLDELFDRIQKEARENPYLYDFKTGNELSFEEAVKMGWHIPTKADIESIEEYSKIPCPQCQSEDIFTVIRCHHKCRKCGVRFLTDVSGNSMTYATLDEQMNEQSPEHIQNKITEEFVKMRDSDLNHQFDYRDRDYFQRGYNLGIISQKDYVTDNEIEKAAEEHALFLGYGGKYNINTAKQVSFIQGAKAMRDGLIKK